MINLAPFLRGFHDPQVPKSRLGAEGDCDTKRAGDRSVMYSLPSIVLVSTIKWALLEAIRALIEVVSSEIDFSRTPNFFK
jgi:hypothetical protein